MRLSRPIGGLTALGVLLGAAGAVFTLARTTIGSANTGAVPLPSVLGTLAVVVLFALVSVLLGSDGDLSTPYW